ncbi:MAG: T9SS type A sorting domain-containing protein [Ignavibacteria bacterium]|jgi:photosystem II stability/assembly factor-like uncharacterized protein|nr:T9SS type A sorting domain-containing protein [Ignavibacteria bacterium]
MEKIILILFLFLVYSESSSQWINQYNSPGTDFYDIEFINNKTGWVCGTGGTILKTTNAGINWIVQNSNVPGKNLRKIDAVNENVLYCVGTVGTIVKTTNGGDNWSVIENGTTGSNSYRAVYFINELTGWISAFQMTMKKTTNGGQSFIAQILNMTPYEIYFKDSLNGIGCSDVATIARTTNGGDLWTIDQINSVSNGNGDFNSMSFINNFTGYIAAGNRLVYRTTNFGANWDSISYVYNSLEPRCIKFINDSVGYCAGSGGEIFITRDRGLTWTRQTNQIGGYIYDINGFKDSLWVCASIGKIASTSNGGVYIQNILSEVPSSFDLHQNYPNPFNGQTNIEFEIKNKDEYNFTVFDIMGREVYSEKKFLSEGRYIINLELDNFSTGVYFYKLSSQKITLTKKMTMIK